MPAMIYSFEILLWMSIMYCPWVEAVVGIPQTQVFQNSSDVTRITPTHSHPTLITGTLSYTSNYWISYTNSVPRPMETPCNTSLDSHGNPVMYTTWYITPSGSSSSSEVTTTTDDTTTSSSSSTTKWSNTSTPYPTTTTSSLDFSPFPSVWPTKTEPPRSYSSSASDCSSLGPFEPYTVWSIVPNTTTVTLTLTGNASTTLFETPEFTPPVYCPETSPAGSPPHPIFPAKSSSSTGHMESTDSAVASSNTTFGFFPPKAQTVTGTALVRLTVTVITTSKNAVTITTQATLPTFPGEKTDKQTVDPGAYSGTHVWSPFPNPPPNTNPPLEVTTIVNVDHSAKTRITFVAVGITVVVSPSQAVIGGQVIPIAAPPKTITQGGDVFTVGPDTVEGPLMVIFVPNYAGNGGVYEEPLKTTTVQGVPVVVGPTGVVIPGGGGGGETMTIDVQPGAGSTTLVVKGQVISVGHGGVGFSGTTISPPPTLPTNVVVVGGQGFSAIGSTVAVIGGTSFVYGPGIAAQTVVLNGEAITVGPLGVIFDGTTVGGAALASGTQYAVAGGLSISEVGSTLAVINGMTFTVGPGTTPMTTIISGQTITAGPNGLVIGGATLTIPFNTIFAQAVTAGGIIFSQVGASVATIGDKTYTFGSGAQQTTTVINGQTISMGPGGIGFKTTRVTALTSRPTGTAAAQTTSKKKSGAERLGLGSGVWVLTAVSLCYLV